MIVSTFSSKEPPEYVNCILCGMNVPFIDTTLCLTVGPGHSFFACATHLSKSRERAWVRNWCHFLVRLQVAALFAFAVRKLVVVVA